jgi:hypothetical protein
MQGDLLLSTAYFPPAEYFSMIIRASTVFIEQEENYIKQTYRNRCKILTSNGILVLSVPVMKGNRIKAKVRDVTIDYSKRWQQVHRRAMVTAYSRSPYFQFYFESLQKVLLGNQKYLLDLNDELLQWCLEILNIKKCILHTSFFRDYSGMDGDFRYGITPKIISAYACKPYIQVFNNDKFVSGLSILDLVFNMGPESSSYL